MLFAMSEIKEVRSKLDFIEKAMDQQVATRLKTIHNVHPSNQRSAENLIRYLTLRSLDLRELQDSLHTLGLSSLASSESHIKRQVQAISQRLGKKYSLQQLDPCDYRWSHHHKRKNAVELFGLHDSGSLPSVMVTFDSSFAEDYALVKNLIQNGMNIARINCAHDDESVWAAMINKVRKASSKTGKPCKIYMDLGGPKLRVLLLGKGRKEGFVAVKEGKLIYLSQNVQGFNQEDIVVNPGEKEVISCLKIGERVYFDDGMVRGLVEKVSKKYAAVRITRVSSQKKLIKNGKGLNFPDSDLKIPSLTKHDISCLPFICDHAHMIGYSFARYADDITYLQRLLWDTAEKIPDLIIKIETPQAVQHLPELLMEGMKSQNVGVMIARGDLAVEIGFERMSEIQEEILWICDAAHIPVIWATQVLESLNKSGIATRSEITDVTHAAQAECIMLNKGGHTIEVLETLKDILLRHSEHRNKKRYIFRPLNIAKDYIGNVEI